MNENLQQLSPTKQEFLRRQNARRFFANWCREAGFEPALHHLLIINKLEQGVENLFKALVRGHEVPEEKLRYIFMTPPGAAKSTYISKLFPPWFLAQIPRLKRMMAEAGRPYVDLGILATTHNGELCVEFGGAARNLVLTHERLLGYQLNRDSRASEAWTCTNGGYYRGATVGSGISGRRMHAGFVDDFIGKEEDATSKLVNDKIWIWWENDFVNRLQPIALRFIIANHRNEDDLIGRLLAKEASKWEVTKIRLLIENEDQAEEDPLGRKIGEYLWPEYFTRAQVEERMSNPRASGIQQQEPSPEKGGFFQADWLQTYDTLPKEALENGRIYIASDHAVSEKQSADYTCIIPACFHNGRLFILPDIVWRRMGSQATVEEMLKIAKRHKPLYWWAEKGHITKSILPFLQDRMMDERAWINLVEVTPVKDKMTRAQSINGMMSMHLVHFPNVEWFRRARHELLVFPNGKHDDFVDALAHLGMGIASMTSGTPCAVQPEFKPNQPFVPTLKWLKEGEERKKRLKMLSLKDD